MLNKSKIPITIQEKGICNRCGRNGHLDDKCHAKTDVIGNYLGDDDYGYNYNAIMTSHKSTIKCDRCGRLGHNRENCYAKVHVKGYYINC